jgi:phosphohistidine phosphatase
MRTTAEAAVLVVLVHHGDAVGPDVDPERPLSPMGRTQVETLAAATAARGVEPAVIWHSGKLRARQTAERFWRACNPLADVAAVRGLRPSDPVEWIRSVLLGEQRDVMLVGHVPNLPRLMRALLAGDEEAPIAFPAHGVVAIEMGADGTAVERWRLEAGS